MVWWQSFVKIGRAGMMRVSGQIMLFRCAYKM